LFEKYLYRFLRYHLIDKWGIQRAFDTPPSKNAQTNQVKETSKVHIPITLSSS
jgi:hypothetical protein